MNIKEFFEKHHLSTNIEVLQSEKPYKGTEENILYLQLDEEVDGQDYLVMSRTLAAKVREDLDELKTASVTKTEEGWGLICHSKVTSLGTISL